MFPCCHVQAGPPEPSYVSGDITQDLLEALALTQSPAALPVGQLPQVASHGNSGLSQEAPHQERQTPPETGGGTETLAISLVLHFCL